MANNTEFTVRLRVADDGTLRVAEKSLGKLGAATDRVADSNQKADKASKNHYSTQEKGVIGTANSTRSFSKLAETIGSGSNGLVGAYATLAANAFAVSAAFNTLRSAAQAEQVLRGLEVQGARTGRTLTLTAEALKGLTGEAISSAEAMQATAQFTAAGFTSDQLLKVGQVATDASKALGRNLPDALDRIIKGTTKLEPELLDELGLMTKLTEATERYALENNKTASSLTSFEKRQAFLNAVIEEGTLKFGGMSEKVEANPYDKLAASFDNLVKTLVNFINNTGIIDFIQFLSENTTALISVIVLFASTIRKDLLGSLNDLSAKAVDTSANLKKLAREQRDGVISTLSAAKGQKELALQTARNFEVVKQSPKVFQSYIDSLKSGTAADTDRERALKSLNKSIETHTRLLSSDKITSDPALKAQKEELIKALQKQADAVRTLGEVETATKGQIEKAETQLASARQKYAQTRTMADAQSRAAASIQEAGNFNLRASMENLSRATSNYATSLAFTNRAQREAATTPLQRGLAVLSGGFNTVRVASFGAITAVRAFGAALLNAIPIIGQILFAISILTEVYNTYFVTKAEKEKKKAFEDLAEVTKNTAEAIKEYNRISQSTAALSARTELLLINQANSAVELANSYIKAQESVRKLREEEAAREEAQRARRSPDGRGPMPYDIQAANRRTAAQELEIAPDSIALKAFSQEISNLGNTGIWLSEKFGSFTVEVQQSMKALDEFNRIAPETVEQFLAMNGGLEEFSKLSVDQRQEKLVELAERIRDRFERIVPAVQSAVQALKSANDSANSFLKGAIQTTPFDGMVDAIGNVNTALFELRDAGITAQDTISLISGIGPDLQRFLTAENSTAVENLRLADQTVQRLQAKINANQQLTSIEQQRLQTARETLSNAEEQLPALEANLNSLEDQFTTAQNIARQSQAQVGLVQAIMSKNQEAYAAGEAGLRARIAREEQIRGLQIAGLEAQRAIIQAALAEQQARLAALRTMYEQAEAARKIREETEKNTLAAAREAAIRANVPLDTQGMPTSGYMLLNEEGRNAALNLIQANEAIKQSDQERARAQQQIVQQQRTVRDLTAATATLSTQIATIAASGLNDAEKAVEYARARGQQERELKALKDANTDATNRNIEAERKLISTIMGTSSGLGDRLSGITAQYDIDRQAITNRFSSEVQALNDDLDVANTRAMYASGLDKAAWQNLAFTIGERIKAKQTEEQIALRALEIGKQQATLEAVGLNTLEERLQFMSDSNQFIAKQIEATKALNESIMDVAMSEQELRAARGGFDPSQSEIIQRANRIKAAKAALDIVKNEADLRKATISLEFALLEAKRKLMIDQARTARREYDTMLAAERAKPGGGSAPIIDELMRKRNELDSSMRAMGATISEEFGMTLITYGEGFNSILERGAKAVDNALTAAENRVAAAEARGPRVQGGFLSQYNAAKEAGLSAKDSEGAITATDLLLSQLDANIERTKEGLKALGPEGEVVLAVAEGSSLMAKSFMDLADAIKEADFGGIAVAGLQVLSSAIQTVSNILKASSDAKIANIDREIAAEQKRDGKSAGSVEKIKAMEKKKDDIARKSFETQKKLQMASVVVNTAAAAMGIAASLSALGPAAMALIPAAVGMIVALGAAQLALIAGTSYQGQGSSIDGAANVSTLSIGKRGDSVDLARGPNASAGGEVGYLRGARGTGSNASNFNTIGSAYGGELMRGYGNRGFVVGEKGPEVITPETPITVTPANESNGSTPINANFNIQALDASDVQRVLVDQKGNIIQMLRDAANASGQRFLEDVNVNVFTRPNVNRL